MEPYTIVGFYADDETGYVEHVNATDATNAADLAPSGVSVVAVFVGHLDSEQCE